MNSPQAENLAGVLYTAYCKAVGGKAFNGEPLPDWQTFKADPQKYKQLCGWIAVAVTAEIHGRELLADYLRSQPPEIRS
jgi:hypothetical protein